MARSVVLEPAGNILVAALSYGGTAAIPFNDFLSTYNALKPAMTGEEFAELPADAFLLQIALQPPAKATPAIDSAIPQVADPVAKLLSLALSGNNFTPLSIVRVNGIVQPSLFVSSKQLTVSGLRIGGGSATRWAARVINLLPGREIAGISNVVVVVAPLCTLPESSLPSIKPIRSCALAHRHAALTAEQARHTPGLQSWLREADNRLF